jgi:hypothetical protein
MNTPSRVLVGDGWVLGETPGVFVAVGAVFFFFRFGVGVGEGFFFDACEFEANTLGIKVPTINRNIRRGIFVTCQIVIPINKLRFGKLDLAAIILT